MRIIAEKNYLPLYFFLLLNILLLKEIILQITLFYLQNKKEQITSLQSCYIWEIVSFKNLKGSA